MKKASKFICVILIGCVITIAVLAPRAESDDPWWMPLIQWCANFAWQLVEDHKEDLLAHPHLRKGQVPLLVDAEDRVAGWMLMGVSWDGSLVFDSDIEGLYVVSIDGTTQAARSILASHTHYYSEPGCQGTLYILDPLLNIVVLAVSYSEGQWGSYPHVARHKAEVEVLSFWTPYEGCVEEQRIYTCIEMEPVELPGAFTAPMRVTMGESPQPGCTPALQTCQDNADCPEGKNCLETDQPFRVCVEEREGCQEEMCADPGQIPPGTCPIVPTCCSGSCQHIAIYGAYDGQYCY